MEYTISMPVTTYVEYEKRVLLEIFGSSNCWNNGEFKPLSAIGMVRNFYNIDLKEAKELVESFVLTVFEED